MNMKDIVMNNIQKIIWLPHGIVNDETNVVTSYDSIEIIHDGEFNNINATAKGSDAASPHSYAVTYDQGTPKDSDSGFNTLFSYIK